MNYVYDALDRLKSMTEVEGAPSSNAAPTITTAAPTNATATAGSQYTLDINANDTNTGDVLEYQIISAPEGVLINSKTGVITWTPTTEQNGKRTIVVQVADNNGGVSNLVVDVQVGTAISDGDKDGVADSSDNCRNSTNNDQRDTDGDGVGRIGSINRLFPKIHIHVP